MPKFIVIDCDWLWTVDNKNRVNGKAIYTER